MEMSREKKRERERRWRLRKTKRINEGKRQKNIAEMKNSLKMIFDYIVT